MGNDPAFLFYPGDYLRDTQCLSEPAQTAYDRIMCEHMRNICITYERLNFFTKRLTPDQKAEVASVLTKIEGGFEIGWVAESIRKRRNYSDSRRKNREGKGEKKRGTYVPHMENEIVIENEDEKLIEYENWTTQILDNNEQYFQTMLMNEGPKLTPETFTVLVRSHLTLLNRYPKMRPPNQQAFRRSLIGFLIENKDKKINGNGQDLNKNQQHLHNLATDYYNTYGPNAKGRKV